MAVGGTSRGRHRDEHRVAASLVATAVLEIRICARLGPEHMDWIHELADLVHTLPLSILAGDRPRSGRNGYQSFRLMWEHASPDQRAWLVAQFAALDYDYSYLDEPAGPAPPASAHWSRSAQWVDAVTLLRLDPTAAFELRHARPGAVHALIPRERDELLSRSPSTGRSEFDALLRMVDGETIVLHLRLEATQVSTLPAGRRIVRWTPPDRDGFLWRRTHNPDDCPICQADRN